jgi:exonuclease III
MRLVSWNILAGGGTRCREIVRRLGHYDADVLVLQETVTARAGDVCHALAAAGYVRIPLRRATEAPPPHAGIYPRGWLEVELEGSGLRIAAVYGPAAGPSLPAYWAAAADWVACRTTHPFIMLGDFNAGASLVDAPDYRFRTGPRFARLAEIGLVDLWRREHRDRREHTWFSRPGVGRAGRGFRIDHEVRERGWSDHSLLLVDLSQPVTTSR